MVIFPVPGCFFSRATECFLTAGAGSTGLESYILGNPPLKLQGPRGGVLSLVAVLLALVECELWSSLRPRVLSGNIPFTASVVAFSGFSQATTGRQRKYGLKNQPFRPAMAVKLLLGLLAGEDCLLGVDDDYMVAADPPWGAKSTLCLPRRIAAAAAGPAEKTLRSVDDIPLAADFLSLGHSSA